MIDLAQQPPGNQCEWLRTSPRKARLSLASVLREWQMSADCERTPKRQVPQSYQGEFGLSSLCAILEDVWAVEHILQPEFDIAILHKDLGPVYGVVTASARPSVHGFYIQRLAVHPTLFMDSEAFLDAAGLLVETVIDASVDSGLHGWVMTTSDETTAILWRSLGFSRQAGPFYGRMGYFDRPPARRPV